MHIQSPYSFFKAIIFMYKFSIRPWHDTIMIQDAGYKPQKLLSMYYNTHVILILSWKHKQITICHLPDVVVIIDQTMS